MPTIVHDIPNAAYTAPEGWKRTVFRTATGVIIGARPGQADDEPEIYIDLPEKVARWLAGRILRALNETPNSAPPWEQVADEGFANFDEPLIATASIPFMELSPGKRAIGDGSANYTAGPHLPPSGPKVGRNAMIGRAGGTCKARETRP